MVSANLKHDILLCFLKKLQQPNNSQVFSATDTGRTLTEIHGILLCM